LNVSLNFNRWLDHDLEIFLKLESSDNQSVNPASTTPHKLIISPRAGEVVSRFLKLNVDFLIKLLYKQQLIINFILSLSVSITKF